MAGRFYARTMPIPTTKYHITVDGTGQIAPDNRGAGLLVCLALLPINMYVNIPARGSIRRPSFTTLVQLRWPIA